MALHLFRLAAREALGLWRRYLGLAVLAGLSVTLVGAGLLVTRGAETALHSEIAESMAQRSIVVTSDFASSDGVVLDVEAVRRMEALPGVQGVEPTLDVPVSIVVDGQPLLMSVSSFRPSLPPPLVKSVRPVIGALGPGEVLLPLTLDGVSLDGLLGTTVQVEHDRFTREGVTSPVRTDMTVVGLVDPAWQQDTPRPAYVAAATTWSWFDLSSADGAEEEVATQGFQEATVVVERAEQVRDTLRAVQAMHLSATATQDLTPALPDQLQIIRTLTKVVLVALVLLAVIASSFLVRSLVLQRTREIGLLKALGYRNRQVWWVLLLEILLVGWAGALGGLLLAALAANLGKGFVPAEAIPRGLDGVILVPQADLVVQILLVTTTAVAVGSGLPLVRAFRLPPAQALRDTL